MNEQDVRSLVREAIERHLGRPVEKGSPVENGSPVPSPLSFARFDVPPGSGVDAGMCLIEPAVRCNHCGFCQSYGH